MDKLYRLIENADAVSFDIFDTLIIRLYRKPVDLFAHLEESFQAQGFRDTRIAAERAAREAAIQRGVHEVTLDEIYDEMHSSYREMEQQEIQLELLMCKANPEMKRVYDTALEKGLPIYICSDMYLPKSVIEEILSNAGYSGYQKLLLSSETLRPKASGEMYEDLIRYSGTTPDRILHIGDHRYTDYQVAMRSGLAAYLYETPYRTAGCRVNSSFFAQLNQYADHNTALSVLEGMIAWRGAGNPAQIYWEEFGYKYIGILAYGYMKWLDKRLKHWGISRVYFMMRDGYIMKQVFDRLFPQYETYEIHGSRRLFLLAGMKAYRDIQPNVTGTGIQGKGITYAQFWDRLCIDNERFHDFFLAKFPKQQQMIFSDAQLHELDDFMEQHTELLLEEGAKERAKLEAYFREIGLAEGRAAIVDLGWKGSMLKGIEGVCSLLGLHTEFTGFYLGTHPCDTKRLHMESYLLDHGKSTGVANAEVLLNSFAVNVLELAFTAPKPSVLKLIQQGDKIIPFYQDVSIHEAERIAISQQIVDGVLAFVDGFQKIERQFPIELRKEAVLAPLEYLANEISRTDQAQIESTYVFPGIGNDNRSRPIFKQGGPVIGIVNPWPGDPSAELEVVTRLKRAAEESQIGFVMLDNFGHILDQDQKATPNRIQERDLSFAITTHYETPKFINAFFYHTLWNPPEIPLNLDYYTERVSNQYIMNDDFLIYDSGGMSNHLRGMLLNCPRTLEGASALTASFPVSAMLAPQLEAPTMFYCGMNWEKVVHGTNRHEGLFKLLDETQKVKFYGPEQVKAWGGLRPWEGYQCYQHPIPFDGFSILKEINQCGICLVLSSDIHRRAGAATNRTYEACAAGAVIISDDNEFMLRYFKDAALFITYNKNNPRDTFRQIMEKYDWILSHKEEALALAEKAQKIFIERFSLDVQLNRLLENHPKRFAQIQKDLYAKDSMRKVLATCVLNTQNMNTAVWLLDKVFQNIHGQIYPNIELAIAADAVVYDSVKSYCETHCCCAEVFSFPLFDKNGVRRMTDGQAIRQLQKEIPHDYYINTNAEEIWFFDHVTSLVRSLENSGELCAYSGSIFHDINGYRHTQIFETISTQHLFHMDQPERPLRPGQFLFRAEAHELVPDFLFDCLDGREHFAYASLLHYKYKRSLAFSRRMSFCFTDENQDVRANVLPDVMQVRFIQDLVKFDLPESSGAAAASLPVVAAGQPVVNPVVTKRSIGEIILLVPIKNYIRLRYYRFRLRKLDPNGKKYKVIEEKYNAVLRQYEDFWG